MLSCRIKHFQAALIIQRQPETLLSVLKLRRISKI